MYYSQRQGKQVKGYWPNWGHTVAETNSGQSAPRVLPITVAPTLICTCVCDVTLNAPVKYVLGPGKRSVPPPACERQVSPSSR